MKRRTERLRLLAREDSGFTLVELILTIFILGIVVAPLTAVVILQLKHTDTTSARMSESHDAQLATSYFAQDVQAMGRHADDSTTAEPAFVQSIDTGDAPAGGPAPCGPTDTAATVVVRIAWDDYADPEVASRTETRVSYVVEGTELHRVLCAGSAAPVDIVVAHNLDLADDPSDPDPAVVECPETPSGSCAGLTAPMLLSLRLIIQDPDSGSDPLEVTLTGQRRQT
jgi:prepilin-type N-terminal cleavage/methylation domain-containing protein